MKINHHSKHSRRDFLKAATALTAFSILPRGIWANSPNSRLQIALVGINGRGGGNLNALSRLPNVDIIALCDVDAKALTSTAALHPKAATFTDYREMLEKLAPKIDAVVVSTPDHMHAPISLAAMELDKHIYCEKPLAHSVGENRMLAEVSSQRNLVTQMGIQVSSTIGQRITIEYIQSGLLGKVSEVHVWSSKSWGSDSLSLPAPIDPIPQSLEWNLWQGVCQTRDFKEKTYHPAQWRRQIDFGTGTLGDMGVHIFHTPFKALELKAPKSVRSTCRPFNGLYHPTKTKVEYVFEPTSFTTSKPTWTWYDGAYAPPQEFQNFKIPADYKMPDQGCLMIGEKGVLILPHQSGPQTFPQDLIRSLPKPKLKPRDHHQNWVEACLANREASAPFSYGGPLTEALQLGVIGMRYPGKTLKWNAAKMKIANLRKANQFLNREYRSF